MRDDMTPIQRRLAITQGKDYDRVPCVPFMSEFKALLCNISIYDFWHSPQKIAQTETACFKRYEYDRIIIGPNTRGISDAMGAESVYPDQGVPYAARPLLNNYHMLSALEPLNAASHPRIQVFVQAAELLKDTVGELVPLEMSIGGPFTIASQLRGTEQLLRDLVKNPEEVRHLLQLIAKSQKSCIDLAGRLGVGVAMADPVANPSLIGPRMYEKFVFPVTRDLTQYALKKTGRGVSLHMCGNTVKIWKFLKQYPLNELSLDNIIDLNQAAAELGDAVPIAGNVDPVETILRGTREDIFRDVHNCITAGSKARKGYTLATGCDIPNQTEPGQIDFFMEAARCFPR